MKLDAQAMQISNDDEGKVNPDGTHAASAWTFRDGEQLDKHLAGLADKKHPFASLSAGDKSAALDIANEARKQIES